GAQVDGVVVDGNGQPVEGATVELWRPLERAAVRLTGADGAFRFRDEESAGAVVLYVTRLGFAPLRATVAPAAAGVRLVLTEARLPLPELVVETATGDEGYAWPIGASSLDGRFEAWEYPPLEADLAGHFADALFLELHTLSVVRADEDGWVLGFCPRPGRGERPVIEGTITLAGDTTFASAEWRFRTVKRFPENAGGKVMFAPRGSSPASSYLLPIEGWY